MIRSLRYVAFGVFLLSAACTPGSSPSPSEAPRPLTLTRGTRVNIGISQEHPGFSYVEQGNPGGKDGFDLHLAKWLSDELGIKKVEVHISLEERVSELREGGVDMVVATFSMTDERRKSVDFVGPYLITHQGVMVRADEKNIQNFHDLTKKGNNVCVADKTTGYEKLKNIERSGGRITVTTKPSVKDCMESLVSESKEVDAVSTDQIVLYGFKKSKQYKNSVRVVKDISFGDEENYGIGIHNNSYADCEAIRKKLEKFLNEKWKTFFHQSFPEISSNDYIKYRPTKTDECENGT